MADNYFPVAYARLLRARAHRDEMWELSGRHLQEFPIQRRNTAEGLVHIITERSTTAFPPEISVVFSEWLHCLRAALDGLMFEIAIRGTGKNPPPNAGRLQFPLYSSAEDFSNKFKPNGISQDLVSMLEAMQPYHCTGGHTGSALWWLHKLARLDRHRQSHVLVWRIINLQVDFDPGVIVENSIKICDQFAAFIQEDEELEVVRCTAKPYGTPQSHGGITVNRTIQFDIIDWVQQSPPSYGCWSLDDRMANLEEVVLRSIQHFERHFTGTVTEIADA